MKGSKGHKQDRRECRQTVTRVLVNVRCQRATLSPLEARVCRPFAVLKTYWVLRAGEDPGDTCVYNGSISSPELKEYREKGGGLENFGPATPQGVH